MRVVFACPANIDAGVEGALSGRRLAAAQAREMRRQVLSRGALSALYAPPEEPELAAAALLADELGLAASKTLVELGTTQLPDPLAALRALQPAAWRAVEYLREEHGPDDQVVAVVQPLTVRAIVCSALSVPLEDYTRFRVEAGSLSIIEFRLQQNRTILASLNETCHLKEPGAR